ncbi:MAG: sulfite exporter TauE/SafE family protein [Bdellovibrionales bacterium]|nr:sulfite exporter TauE/SafE family protein [Bdellovibrionales bacterium]
MIIESYYYIIWVAAFFTAVVSATVGMLGGTLILAVMAQYLKMEVLIPIHGLIQFTSNSSRAWFIRDAINWKISRECLLGIIIGSVAGSFFVIRIEESFYNIFLGVFILTITFIPKFKLPLPKTIRWVGLGFISSFIGLFLGAVGVFVGAVFLSEKLPKRELVATQATVQLAVHLAKVIVFTTLGFVIWPWLTLLLGALVCTSLGSFVGSKLLDKIPEKLFRAGLTVLIVILGLRLIYSGFRL